MSYTTLRKNENTISFSLNDPYNTSSYNTSSYTKETFVPFNFGGIGSGQSQINSQVAQQQAQQQAQIIQLQRQQQEKLQEEQNTQIRQRILNLQLIEKIQNKDYDKDLKVIYDLNKEIDMLDKIISLNKQLL